MEKPTPCFPSLSKHALLVTSGDGSHECQYHALNETFAARKGLRSVGAISLQDFIEIVQTHVRNDSITLNQACQLKPKLKIDFPPSSKPIDALLATLIKKHESFLVYVLKPLEKCVQEFAYKDDWLRSSTNDVLFSDPEGLDNLGSMFKSRFQISRSKLNSANGFLVAHPSVVKTRAREIISCLNKGLLFRLDPDNSTTYHTDVFIISRLLISSRCNNLNYSIQLSDGNPGRAAFKLPNNYLLQIDSILANSETVGVTRYSRMIKLIHKNTGYQLSKESGLCQYLNNFDWATRNARVFFEGTKENELLHEEQPLERRVPKVALRMHPDMKTSDLIVCFRFKCLASRCQHRFKNETLRQQHLIASHGLNRNDVAAIREVDACETSQLYKFVDERKWLMENNGILTPNGCSLCNNLVDKARELAQMHVLNSEVLKQLEREQDQLMTLRKGYFMSRTEIEQTLAKVVDQIEIGKNYMLDEKEFVGYQKMFLDVMGQRIQENQNIGAFVKSRRERMQNSSILALWKLVDTDFASSVEAAGRDFSVLSDAMASFQAGEGDVKIQDNSLRTAIMVSRLANHGGEPNRQKRQRQGYIDRIRAVKSSQAFDHPEFLIHMSEDAKVENDEKDAALPPKKTSSKCADLNSITKRFKGDDDDADDGNSGGGFASAHLSRSSAAADDEKLVEFKPEKIKVHKMDVLPRVSKLANELLQRDKFSVNDVFEFGRSLMFFFDESFHLSKDGDQVLAQAFKFVCTDAINHIEDVDQVRSILFDTVQRLFSFLNSNDDGHLSNLFRKRFYTESDQLGEIVKIATKETKYQLSKTYNPVGIDSIGEAEPKPSTNHSGYRKKQCSICLQMFEERTLTPLPCCHVFHRVCFNKWIKEKALSYKDNQVVCPLCHTVIYDRQALNVIRIDLLCEQLSNDENLHFQPKMTLHKSSDFQIDCDEKTTKTAITHLLQSIGRKTDLDGSPYKLNDVDFCQTNCDIDSDDVSAIHQKLTDEGIVKRKFETEDMAVSFVDDEILNSC